MKIINLLIIDDNPDIVIIKNMCEELMHEGYQVCPFWLNPQDTFYQNKSLTVDTEKFEKAIKKSLIINDIHIVACDNGLGDGLTGITVLARIRDTFHFRGINLLFTNSIGEILHEILEAQNKDFSYKRDMLKKLVRSHSIEFPTRDDLPKELKAIIRKNKLDDINLRHEILKWLYAFKGHFFNGHPDLERKTCGEIAEAIEMETSLGVQFQKLLIEQGLSTMIKLNKLPANE
jgi:hypothetical protein